MADSRSKRFERQYNIMLDETQQAMLRQMSATRRIPASQIIREWIDTGYRMAYNREPRCVSGQNCLCPMAHQWAPPAAVPATDLLRQHGGTNGPQKSNDAS